MGHRAQNRDFNNAKIKIKQSIASKRKIKEAFLQSKGAYSLATKHSEQTKRAARAVTSLCSQYVAPRRTERAKHFPKLVGKQDLLKRICSLAGVQWIRQF